MNDQERYKRNELARKEYDRMHAKLLNCHVNDLHVNTWPHRLPTIADYENLETLLHLDEVENVLHETAKQFIW